tara:strand:- start:683 stop:1003 length:321 start_codon:yes stop_codon:yes gene_type:complete
MNLTKSLVLFFGLSIILNSCSSFSDIGKVMRNEKIETTDEFLIKKKGSLKEPPDFEKIPEPGSIENKAETDQDSIKKILRTRKSESSNSQTQSSSTEQSILKQIKK